ncbi:alpha-glucosidase C-terminal domain-containing protein [Fibrella sp. HMF5335]|uniref:Alpha-glucosidase C-terminal domain-containing protein n=1 Tax=Fibrella rubiginis TaxID=2817060 RepID=A0A939K254_9BACT|nr:alpha-amylase family glycosyl hydrolase [Fibrella rubiginis]MBO0935949.1 alpha-glucosidase C-terminal domain-containing protein [Fibrella rubiginis]
MKNQVLYASLFLSLFFTGCKFNQQRTDNQPASDSTTAEADSTATATADKPAEPEWAKNATIYEVNVRQFSAKGDLASVETQLPRLKELGVDIVWMMPIYPVGKVNRKGSMGSPYAVADYMAVNPDYGTVADLKRLVKRAHDLGLRVILDFIPNHTAWDHPWTKQHPDWYTTVNGKMTSPLDEKGKPTGWDDVVDLDYSKPELRKAMTSVLTYWLRETDIDGYRMDVAGLVPTDYWKELRPALDDVKPVFMLAEWEADPAHFRTAFNMNYGWAMHTLLKNIAKGTHSALAIDTLLAQRQKEYPDWAYQMQFTQNHDENTWNGTLAESFGPGAKAFVVLTSTFNGMPLVYNGAEAGLNKRLQFFEKDPISWGTYSEAMFYKSLLTLKHRNRALWNGKHGGPLVKIPTGHDAQVYAFYRQKDNDHVAVIINLSGQPQTIKLGEGAYAGLYTDVFAQTPMELKNDMSLTLKPWAYHVLTN